MKKVIFFVKKFPVLSQTFVIEQINSLIEKGVDVEIIALYKEETEVKLNSMEKNKLLERSKFISSEQKLKSNKVTKLFFISYFFIYVLFFKRKLQSLASLSLKALRAGKVTLAYEIAVVAMSNRSRTFSADSIIAHFGHNGVLAQKLSNANILSGKLLTVFHGYEVSEYDSISFWKDEYIELSYSSTLLPISDYWKQRLVKWGAQPDAIQVHHMGVDVERFAFTDRPINKPVQIVSVARATEKKGLEFALRAMEFLDSNFQLTIIGGGELSDTLKRLSEELGVIDRVKFYGPQPPQFVKETLDLSDIFLLPSVTDSLGDMEGIPVALMEAMASGLIVVSTFHSGIPELIENEISGYLVPERDPEKIAQALRKVASSRELSNMRQAARAKVETEFNSLNLVNKLYSKI